MKISDDGRRLTLGGNQTTGFYDDTQVKVIELEFEQPNYWNLLDDDVLAWHQAVQPSADFLRQLMDVRRLIEPRAAMWAAQKGSAEQIAQIASARDAMEAATTGEDFVIADAMFHRAILHAANNEILMAMEGVIFSALLSSIQLTNADPRNNKRSVQLHRQLLVAIENGNASAAGKAMEKHLNDTHQRLSGAVPGFSRADDL